MKMKKILKLSSFIGISVLLLNSWNCSLDDMFEQPKVSVSGMELLEMPKDTTKLNVTVKVKNVDSRDADIHKVVYTATIEGVKSSKMTYSKHFEIKAGASKTLTLPLTLPTDGAIDLLAKLTDGASLSYQVDGKFDADTPIGRKDLTLDVKGKANLSISIDDFFEQPKVEVNEIKIASLDLNNVKVEVLTTITNQSEFSADISQVKPTIKVDGISSTNVSISPETFTIEAGASQDITLAMTLTTLEAAPLMLKNEVDYTVTGTFTATTTLGDGKEYTFTLPLSVSGTEPTKAALNGALDTANDLMDQYSSTVNAIPIIGPTAVSTFQTAIDSAQAVADDGGSTQDVIDGATDSLGDATDTFGGYIPGI